VAFEPAGSRSNRIEGTLNFQDANEKTELCAPGELDYTGLAVSLEMLMLRICQNPFGPRGGHERPV
jgi:hypothetical protein